MVSSHSRSQRLIPWLVITAMAFATTSSGACYSGRGEFDGNSAGNAEGDPLDPTEEEEPEVAEGAPGTVVLHRLNRVEYNNTVRDLLWGLDVDPADRLPEDPRDGGFLNIAEVLGLGSLSLQLYEQATNEVIDVLFADPERLSTLSPCESGELDETCVTAMISEFGLRAWRRPLESDEVAALNALAVSAHERAGDWDSAARQVVKALLLSPHFLFRVEIDPDPDSTDAHRVSDYELASRLSYLLWSSMPDDELFQAATAGELHERDSLIAQTKRMLDDPRAEALVDNFASQWLELSPLVDGLEKDEQAFPTFGPSTARSMHQSVRERLLATFFDGRDLRDLLGGTTSFVDAELAKIYDIEPPAGSGFSEVDLGDERRKGLLTEAGILSLLANRVEPATVSRGLWVLDRLLCIRPDDPPEGLEIPELEPQEGETAREELSRHRADPQCAGCHNLIDPFGLALEQYDAVGRFRDVQNGQTIDPSGRLITGESFEDAFELAGLLTQQDNYPRCVTSRLLTYALGRRTTADDQFYIDAIATRTAESLDFESLIIEIVTSEPFRMRQGPGGQ